MNILRQLALSFKLDVPNNQLEQGLIQEAYKQVKNNKTLYILIDEAHLLEMRVLRKLRLLFDRFPKKHNLVLFGQYELMYHLSMTVNEDIKTRITFSGKLLPLNDEAIKDYITEELEAARLGLNVFDEGAIELIVRTVQGNLRC